MSRRIASMVLVALIHGLLLTVALSVREEPPHKEEPTIAVQLLADAPSDRKEEAQGQPPPEVTVPAPVVLVDFVFEMPASIAEEVPEMLPRPAEPVSQDSDAMPGATAGSAVASTPDSVVLTGELAIQCPERSPPLYPSRSKRQREQGEVRLRVELDERGQVAHIDIVNSSGFPLLDEAAASAVANWHCRPALKDGAPVPAVALQSLVFKLQRN